MQALAEHMHHSRPWKSIYLKLKRRYVCFWGISTVGVVREKHSDEQAPEISFLFLFLHFNKEMLQSLQFLERSGLTEMLIGLKLFLLQAGKIFNFFFRMAKLKLQDKTRLIHCSKRKIIPLVVNVCLILRSGNKKNQPESNTNNGQRTLSFVFLRHPSMVFLSPLILQSGSQGGSGVGVGWGWDTYM